MPFPRHRYMTACLLFFIVVHASNFSRLRLNAYPIPTMTLVAGRMPGLHTLERNSYVEDSTMQGILKSGPTRKVNRNITSFKQVENNQKSEEGRRLVRFCESEEEKPNQGVDSEDGDSQEVFMFGSNMYYVNHSDPNSAVRKLFPNSKLTPINPNLNRSNLKENISTQGRFFAPNSLEVNRNTFNNAKPKFINDYVGTRNPPKRKVEVNTTRRSFMKIPPETKPKPGKLVKSTTPLIERIKQLTCDDDTNILKDFGKEESSDKSKTDHIVKNASSPNHKSYSNTQHKDLPKQTKEGLNLMRYNNNILQERSQHSDRKCSGANISSVADEARRSFLFSLSQDNVTKPGDRISISTNSSNADTVYSLSDIEEALTEEEKEIKEAFAHENSRQDELELFVQQDAGRTERLRKRYSSTPKPENFTNKPPTFFTNKSCSSSNLITNIPLLINQNCTKNDRPKFGSTIEILQQLQQQIETPYQMEGRRTACSNYSDSSIPLSERLFCNESSDGYEPVVPKLNVHRTCSLDSKNYEEIDHCQSAFSVPRTKSHEHPRLIYIGSDYYHSPNDIRYCGNFAARKDSRDLNIYASSPDIYANHQNGIPDRVMSYTSHPVNTRQLHPVLQKQYCRYPVNQVPPKPAEEGKILTPPSRMHTYMNIPANAPCYSSPPPYTKVNPYIHHTVHSDVPHCDALYSHSNIYQNIPLPTNRNLMTIRRLCTESERGVPEGSSSSHDSKELYPIPQRDFYYPANVSTIPKPSSLPHQYCVDV